jgi:nicotinate-nucleotide adenylyltransferase
MRIGIFGGTFDPIHLGHLILAEQCREQARLDQVLLVPAARPPHKPDQVMTPFARRVEMIALAIAGHRAFQIDELEKERLGPSYTIETLEALHQRYPQAELALILGSDCLPDLAHWREPVRILELATLLLAPRPGWSLWPDQQLRASLGLAPEARLRQEVIHSPLIEISSRDLRRRVREGHTIRYLVPRAVEKYIEEHNLYKLEKI